MKLTKLDLERIVKMVVLYNNNLELNKKYLKVFDNYDLIVFDEDDNIMLKTIMNKEI